MSYMQEAIQQVVVAKMLKSMGGERGETDVFNDMATDTLARAHKAKEDSEDRWFDRMAQLKALGFSEGDQTWIRAEQSATKTIESWEKHIARLLK